MQPCVMLRNWHPRRSIVLAFAPWLTGDTADPPLTASEYGATQQTRRGGATS
jgi:hypothetical protein